MKKKTKSASKGAAATKNTTARPRKASARGNAAVTTARRLTPKPKATHPTKSDVGIFGTLENRIRSGLTAIAETVFPEKSTPQPRRRVPRKPPGK